MLRRVLFLFVALLTGIFSYGQTAKAQLKAGKAFM